MTTYILQFADNAVGTLAAAITSASPSLQMTSGEGALFPALSTAQAFIATLIKNGNPAVWETVLVTGRSGDNFTGLVRNYEPNGVGALAWNAGDSVIMAPTAGTMAAFAQVPTAQAQASNYAADTGAANAYVVNLTPALNGHVIGMPIRFKAAHSNTGASTFNDGIGAVSLITPEGFTLISGDIVAGGVYEAVWDGTHFQVTDLHAYNFTQLLGQIANNQVPQSAVTQFQAALAIAFSQLTGKPTTVSGYGITDALTAASLISSFGASGFVKIPTSTGTFIVQWGLCNPNGGTIAVTFPTAFPNACLSAVGTSTGIPTQCDIPSVTRTTLNIFNTGGESFWIAVGF